MAASDCRPVPIKNVAFRVVFPILDNTGQPVTGAAGLDSEVSKDQGTFTDCTNEATEIATSSGIYYLDLTSTEMNADCVAVIVKTSTTDAKTSVIVLYPEETGDINVDVTAFGGTAGTFSGGRAEVNTSHIAGSAVSTSTAQIGVNVVNFGGSAGTFASGRPEVNTTHLSGASQTARDIGASVLLSPGTGTGQITLSSGTVTVGTNNDKTGYSLTQSFPSNFSSLAINGSGHVILQDASLVTAKLGTFALAKTTNITGFNDLSAAQVNTEVDTGLSDVGLTSTVTGRIDVAVSTRLASASYTAPLDAAGTRSAIGLASANLDTQLDALPSAAENATAIWAAGTRTITGGTIGTITGLTISGLENMQTRWAGMTVLDGDVYQYTANALELAPSGGSTPAQVADAVWDELLAGHVTAGSAGAALSAAGSAGDPWSTLLPGAYAAGTAGAIIGTTIPGLLQDAEITLSSPVAEDGETVTLRTGDDYLQAIGTQVAFTWSGLAYSLTGATVVFRVGESTEWTMTVSSSTAAYLERTNAQTSTLIPGSYAYEIDATLTGGQKVTLATGTLVVTKEL